MHLIMVKLDSSSRMKIDDMYSNLPRSLKAECLVRSKVEEDETKLRERQKIVQTMKPAELASFSSITDFPVPSALENIFKTSEKPEAPPRKDSKEQMDKRRFHMIR